MSDDGWENDGDAAAENPSSRYDNEDTNDDRGSRGRGGRGKFLVQHGVTYCVLSCTVCEYIIIVPTNVNVPI